MSKGKLIVFDGNEATGKSTLVKNVVSWLNEIKIKAIATRHPGSTPIGTELRKLLKENKEKRDIHTEALMLAADNSAFIDQILIPELNQDTWVICDRNNFITSLAYQIAGGMTYEELSLIHNATKPAPPIDLLFILRASESIRSQRMEERQGNYRDNFESKGKEYQDKIEEIYYNLINTQSHILRKFVKCDVDTNEINAINVDANGTQSEVFNKIRDIILGMILDKKLN